MKQERYYFIDVLRALSILGVIAIHVYSQNLYSTVNTAIWNYLQFVVPPFVFCSGFVLFARYQGNIANIQDVLSFYRKRLLRLLSPFYVFFIIYYGLFLLLPQFFSGLGMQKSIQYVLASVFLYGGENLNWLPLLFLQLAILFPLYMLANKLLKNAYIILVMLIAMITTFAPISYNDFRWTMWISWSLIFLSGGWIVSKKWSQQRYLIFGVLWLAFYILLYIAFLHAGRSVKLYDNKYPPNLFYLSYGMGICTFLFVISKLQFWEERLIKNAITFISTSSYQLFFIHWVVLDFFTTTVQKQIHINAFFETVVIILTSLMLRKLLLDLSSFLNFYPKSLHK